MARPAKAARDRAYYRRRNQNRLNAAIAAFFAEEAAAGRITLKQIADAMETSQAQVRQWLTEPASCDIDTISDILSVMNAEMNYCVTRVHPR